MKQRRTNEVMKVGGREKGWEGSWLMWFIRQDLKCSVAVFGGSRCCISGGKSGEAGELSGLEALEFDSEGVSARWDCLG